MTWTKAPRRGSILSDAVVTFKMKMKISNVKEESIVPWKITPKSWDFTDIFVYYLTKRQTLLISVSHCFRIYRDWLLNGEVAALCLTLENFYFFYYFLCHFACSSLSLWCKQMATFNLCCPLGFPTFQYVSESLMFSCIHNGISHTICEKFKP